jgi:hypothetical protein
VDVCPPTNRLVRRDALLLVRDHAARSGVALRGRVTTTSRRLSPGRRLALRLCCSLVGIRLADDPTCTSALRRNLHGHLPGLALRGSLFGCH